MPYKPPSGSHSSNAHFLISHKIMAENDPQTHFSHSICGFTLIELIAVISILSIMLFFSIPRFGNFSDSGNLKSVSRWVIANVHALKERAVSDQKRYTLHVGLDSNSFMVTNESMIPQELETADPKVYQLPPGITIIDVEYPGKGVIRTGQADINFYRQGYSDKVLIHIEDQDQNLISFLIEPFLPAVKISEDYLSFF